MQSDGKTSTQPPLLALRRGVNKYVVVLTTNTQGKCLLGGIGVNVMLACCLLTAESWC